MVKYPKLNTLLKGYIQTKSPKKALVLFQSIENKRASLVDSFSLHFVLKACAMRSSQAEGKQIHGVILKLGFGGVISLQTTLMNLYSESGSVEAAHQVFDEIAPRNIISWTALISAYVDNGKPSRALELFREMQSENIEPDQVTVTVALSACADLGRLDMGERIHSYIRQTRRFKADLCLNNALINMYVKCGDINTARKMFDRLPTRDVTSWTSIITGHAVHGYAEEALKLFDEMKVLVEPNEVTFIGVLMACSHGGMVEQGWKHFNSMKKNYNLKPQVSHYGCMVDLLCRAGLLKEAYNFITNMAIRPNAVVWRTLLGACSLQGDIELAANARRKLLELDPTYVGDNVVLSNTYAYAGMWDEKIAVRDLIKNRRSPGCSSVELHRS